MDVICPYCDASQEATVPICTECNKYWFITRLNRKYRILYDNLIENDIEHKEQEIGNFHRIYNLIIEQYDNIEKIKSNILSFVRSKTNYNLQEGLYFLSETKKYLNTLKNKISQYDININIGSKYIKLQNIGVEYNNCKKSNSYLSTLYDCKALIESKRDSIPYNFENNRRLVKLLQYISIDSYSNLEQRLYNFSYFNIGIFAQQEMTYLFLEIILDNFSEIGTNNIFNKFNIIYKYYMENYDYCIGSCTYIVNLLK